MSNQNLQETLYSLISSGSGSHLGFQTLLEDYTRYHLILLIEAGIFALLCLMIGIYFWRKYIRARKTSPHAWTFEKKAFFCFALVGVFVTLFLSLVVAANLSTVLNPENGFAQLIPELHTPQDGTQKAALYQSVNTWIQSENPSPPSLLQNEVNNRLSWQRPKAIIASVLLILCAIFTASIWGNVLRSRAQAQRILWSVREKIFLVVGILCIPVILFLMILALANTQSSYAPITLTILSGGSGR